MHLFRSYISAVLDYGVNATEMNATPGEVCYGLTIIVHTLIGHNSSVVSGRNILHDIPLRASVASVWKSPADHMTLGLTAHWLGTSHVTVSVATTKIATSP